MYEYLFIYISKVYRNLLVDSVWKDTWFNSQTTLAFQATGRLNFNEIFWCFFFFFRIGCLSFRFVVCVSDTNVTSVSSHHLYALRSSILDTQIVYGNRYPT